MVVSLVTLVVSSVLGVGAWVAADSRTRPDSWSRRVSHAVKPINSANAATAVFIFPPRGAVPSPGDSHRGPSLQDERLHWHPPLPAAVICLTGHPDVQEVR